MKNVVLCLLAALFAQGCSSSSLRQHPMEAAINRAWMKAAAMEVDHPALSGFSKTRPEFVQDEKGLVKARLQFASNATPYGKGAVPSAADKSKPFCYLIVSIWRPNNLPSQPTARQREYKIGKMILEGYVTVFSSDPVLTQELYTIFESDMDKAEGRKTRRPPVPGA